MKSTNMTKFVIKENISSIRGFYLIFILIIGLLTFVSRTSDGNMNSSGLEFASVVFLFITGLNAFKSNFYFSQAMNVSRGEFLKGLILATYPIALTMSVIDVIINRVYNLFIPSPTMYDMLYTAYRNQSHIWDWQSMERVWFQLNDIGTLAGTVLWQFSLYSTAVMLGLFITIIYYRSNKLMKVLISVSPIVILFFLRSLISVLPIELWVQVRALIDAAFGITAMNEYMAVLTYLVLSVLLALLAYLLARRAEVKTD